MNKMLDSVIEVIQKIFSDGIFMYFWYTVQNRANVRNSIFTEFPGKSDSIL